MRGAKRDEIETVKRAYLDPRSFAAKDGREFLMGEDWLVRRHEAWERSGGFCEEPGCNRCLSEETGEPHHEKFRSKGGDDSLANIRFVCRRCHRSKHPEKELQWTVRV